MFSPINSLYFDPKHSVLWVADGGNNRIRRFQHRLLLLSALPNPLDRVHQSDNRALAE